MGKGNDPNCATTMAMVDAAPTTAEEMYAAMAATVLEAPPAAGETAAPAEQAKPKRNSKRGKRKEFTEEEKAAYYARVDEQLKALDNAVSDLADNPQLLTDWLQKMASERLWRYSYGNLVLARAGARMQGFEPTRLASKSDWWKLGYMCKKDVSGLDILAPRQKARWVPKTDAAGNEIINPKTGKPYMVKAGTYTTGFKFAKTFDISQMTPRTDKDGNPLNQELVSANPVGAEQATRELSEVARRQGVQVFLGGADDPDFQYRSHINTELMANPDANGFYTEIRNSEDEEPTRVIVTRAGLGPDATARVLAHELAHAQLHAGEGYKDLEDRQRKEVEAEGTAYVISSFYGLPTERQAHYVAHWAQGQEKAHLKAATNNIQRAVKGIMEVAEDVRMNPDADNTEEIS